MAVKPRLGIRGAARADDQEMGWFHDLKFVESTNEEPVVGDLAKNGFPGIDVEEYNSNSRSYSASLAQGAHNGVFGAVGQKRGSRRATSVGSARPGHTRYRYSTTRIGTVVVA